MLPLILELNDLNQNAAERDLIKSAHLMRGMIKSIIKNAWLCPIESPRFLKPYAMKFNVNGVEKTWEVAKAFDSVAVLIYNTDRKVGD
jgi:hypothetical protein